MVDTYDTVAAISKIIKNSLNVTGIRLDSGDLYSLSIEARRLLDSAGHVNTKIMASRALLSKFCLHAWEYKIKK